jgi:methylated-DNA-[protein]-cysteine S-methyltransferase
MSATDLPSRVSPFRIPCSGAPTRYTVMESPVASLLLLSDGESLTGLHMIGGRGEPQAQPSWIADRGWFGPVVAELQAYFAGTLTTFATPLAPEGTPFQRTVWAALTEIPFGETWSYGTLARQIRNPAASRAVGLANGRNPISIIIPCHRVIGANGALTGYGGGLDKKAWLLRHEAASIARMRGFTVRS